ncbi:MAG: sigE 3 [Candidatus Paceibacter sp.]|jgi:RNA polymerase sigma-70 factor (ECF subfamily)|nr:sigE 3 [Candidatus Paceibacter sp.]
MDKIELFNKIWKDHRQAVFGFCWYKLRNSHDANDAVQETFSRLWENIIQDRFVEGNIKALVFTIARNVMLDGLRKQKKCPTILFHDFSDINQHEVHESSKSSLAPESATMKAAFKLVGEKEREALTLHYIDNHSVSEITHMLGCNYATVHRRISRGSKKIRALLTT